LNKNYLEVVSTISRIIREFVSQEKNLIVSEIIASQIDIPWKQSEISRELGTESLVRSAIIRNKEFINWVVKNLIYGLLIFFRMVISIAKRPKPIESICLLYSLTPSQLIQGQSSLRDFLTESRLGLNVSQDTRIIVEQPGAFRERRDFQSNMVYVKNISSFYFEEYLTFSQRKNVLFNSIRRAFQLLVSAKFIDLLFFRQTILESEIDMLMLRNEEYICLITSQTNLRKLPTVFYLKSLPRVERIMIWYSNNSFVIEKKTEINEFDSTRYVRSNIDSHLVWGEKWKSQLESVNPSSSIRNVGSLMWYPNASNFVKETSSRVVIFDVVPFSSYKHYDFYSYDLVSSFLRDIHESVVESKETSNNTKKNELLLKQKREFQKNTDSAYIDLLKQLEKCGSFKVLGSDENLYNLVASSNAVIGIPFVSPVFIANEMCVPCCYYVGEGASEWSIPDELDGVEVIVGKEQLQKWLGTVL
jgi:polysaccharide biosynthesis PFTS motif protein